jgi:hypothetical protein
MLCTNKNGVFCYFINVYSMFEARLSHKSTALFSVTRGLTTLTYIFWTPMDIIHFPIGYCLDSYEIKKTKPIILGLHDV